MALDPKIASIKAAGTYRFEFDKSQIVSIPANQTRLIVGFSKKGPFNTPVFVPDTVKNAWKVTVLSFQDLGNATVNCACSSEDGSKSKTFNSGPLDNSACANSAQPLVDSGYMEDAGIHIVCLPPNCEFVNALVIAILTFQCCYSSF